MPGKKFPRNEAPEKRGDSTEDGPEYKGLEHEFLLDFLEARRMKK
jgi:hypothetical protein